MALLVKAVKRFQQLDLYYSHTDIFTTVAALLGANLFGTPFNLQLTKCLFLKQ